MRTRARALRPIHGPIKMAAATAAFGLVHSLLASRPAKAAAERWLGTRGRNAAYRPLYNAAAVVTSAALAGYVRRQPGRTLYHVRGPAGALMRAGQAAAVAGLVDAAWRTGPARFAGLPGLWAWLAGRSHVPREPEGQSPPPGPDGRYDPGGTYRVVRHPTNLFIAPVLWLNPRMTTTLAAFSVVATAYLYAGSVHSDRRLARRYGPAYAAYQRSGVPLFLPSPGPPRRRVTRGTLFPVGAPRVPSATKPGNRGRSGFHVAADASRDRQGAGE